MIDLGHLDLNVVENCTMRCVSCSHASPYTNTKTWQMTPEELAADLAAIKPFVRFHRLQMVGGEPLLHKNLPEMMRVARASGVGREIMVITNGQLLHRMEEDFWHELDTLQLSIYPKLAADVPFFARGMCEKFGKPFYSTVYTEFHQQFRTTPSDGSNFAHCHWKSDCWTLHRGHFYLCPQSAFFPKNFMGLGDHVDGLPLTDLTEEKLQAFISRAEPLNACRICMANEMKPKPWREAKTREEWIEASAPSKG